MRSRIWSLLFVVLLLLGGTTGVSAMEEWCDSDPLVAVKTPGGNIVPVYVTSGALGTEHLPAVVAASISYTVKPAEGGRATQVKIRVVVPGDLFDHQFPTRTTASTGPLATGTIYATTSGTSGQPMDLVFKLAVP